MDFNKIKMTIKQPNFLLLLKMLLLVLICTYIETYLKKDFRGNFFSRSFFFNIRKMYDIVFPKIIIPISRNHEISVFMHMWYLYFGG